MIKKKAWVQIQSSEKETDDSQTVTVNEVNDCQRGNTTDFYEGEKSEKMSERFIILKVKKERMQTELESMI